MKTTITVGDCVSAAFQALLRGDLEERDKLCAMAERAFTNNSSFVTNDTPIPLGKDGTQ